jgi:hypothetical protein
MQVPTKQQAQRALSELGVSLALELAVVAAIRRIRRGGSEDGDSEEGASARRGILRSLVGGMFAELGSGMVEEVRWQRRRASAAIDRAAARESLAPRHRALPVIPSQPVRRSAARASAAPAVASRPAPGGTPGS